MVSGLAAELVIGPATSGRTRWRQSGMTRVSVRIRPALRRLPLMAGALPVALPVAGRSNAVDAGRAGDGSGFGGIEHHHGLAALTGLIESAPQQPAVGGDRLVGRAEMLLGAVLDRPHRLARPLVVHIDVGAHARIGRVLLLVRIESVVVALVLARHVVRQFVKLEPLAAHLILVDG